MAVKRKSVLNLDEIVNEKQRAVAYIVSDYAHRFSMTNSDIAGVCGLSQSAISSIFRREARSVPGVKVLQSLAVGLTKRPYGQIDPVKAEQLYIRLMQAAGHDINANPFTPQLSDTARQDAMGMAEAKEIIMAGLLRMPYQKSSRRVSSPSGQGFHDLVIAVEGCPCLDEWDFSIFLQPQTPSDCTTRFLMGLLSAGYRKTGKYSIVTDSGEIYDILSAYDWSGLELYVSVILLSEDGGIEERHIRTANPHEALIKAGLTF